MNSIGFGEKLRSRTPAIGTIVNFTDPTVSELLAQAGFDFIWLDLEHGGLDITTVQLHIMAVELGGTTPLVRVPANDPVWIKRVLDAGAAGVIAPMVHTAADAANLVAACRYPPLGIRGYGPRRPSRYGRSGGAALVQAANQEILAIAQIEHVAALSELAAILQTPGLDSIFIGPTDLAVSMDRAGQVQHPEVQAVIAQIIAAAQARHMPVGLFVAGNAHAAQAAFAQGITWVACATDYLLLAQAADTLCKEIRETQADAAM